MATSCKFLSRRIPVDRERALTETLEDEDLRLARALIEARTRARFAWTDPHARREGTPKRYRVH